MTEVKKIDVISLARIVGIIYLVIGLIAGLIFACFGLLALVSGIDDMGVGLGEAGIMLLGVCFLPIFYGVIGFIAGAIIALIYNLVANRFGGVKFELVRKDGF